jgi:hypothetical protein
MLTPSLSLAKGAQYTVKVDGVKDKSGNAVVSHTWSFTTR